MTVTTDPRRLADAIAHLQRGLAALRRDLAYLTRSSLRQDKQHLALHKTVQDMAEQISYKLPSLKQDVLLAQYAADKARKDINWLMDQQRVTADWAVWVEAGLKEMDLWVQYLAARFWPKAQALHGSEQIKRIFPNGFAVVPNHRQPKKRGQG